MSDGRRRFNQNTCFGDIQRNYGSRFSNYGYRHRGVVNGWSDETNGRDVFCKDHNRQIRDNRRAFSVYVTGFPIKATWMWIRNMFRDVGNVLDVFVASKRTRDGDHFAFVRYSSWDVADQAVSRLNGRYVAGRHLAVSHAKGGGRSSYWRKKTSTPGVRQNANEEDADGLKTRQLNKLRKSCQLEFDSEKLKILTDCYVGTAVCCCSAEYLLDRLKAMNLHDICMSRVASRKFMIGFLSEEVRRMMESDNWCCLSEWFSEIVPWRPDLVMEERIARLHIQGLPLVAWNKDNFDRLAMLWGDLISDDCSVIVPDDARICTIHVSTKILNWINEEIDIKFGDSSTVIRVFESSTETVWKSAFGDVSNLNESLRNKVRWDKTDYVVQQMENGNDKVLTGESPSSGSSGDIPVHLVADGAAKRRDTVFTEKERMEREFCGVLNILARNQEQNMDDMDVARLENSYRSASFEISRVPATNCSKLLETVGSSTVNAEIAPEKCKDISADKSESGKEIAALCGVDKGLYVDDSATNYLKSPIETDEEDILPEDVVNVLTTAELDAVRLGNCVPSMCLEVGESSTTRKRKPKSLLDIYGGRWGPRLSRTMIVSKGKKNLKQKKSNIEIRVSSNLSCQEGSEKTTDSDLRSCYKALIQREEAKFTLEVGKLAGFDTKGRDEEAIDRIMRIQANSRH